MPKTPARDDYFAQSFRFTPEQTAVIKEEAKRLGSTTAFVRELHTSCGTGSSTITSSKLAVRSSGEAATPWRD